MRKIVISISIIFLIMLIGILLKDITLPDSFARTKPRITGTNGYSFGDTQILIDNETKVMYLFVKNGYGAGLTVMVDKNGKPLIKE